jgi:hypothetical protein
MTSSRGTIATGIIGGIGIVIFIAAIVMLFYPVVLQGLALSDPTTTSASRVSQLRPLLQYYILGWPLFIIGAIMGIGGLGLWHQERKKEKKEEEEKKKKRMASMTPTLIAEEVRKKHEKEEKKTILAGKIIASIGLALLSLVLTFSLVLGFRNMYFSITAFVVLAVGYLTYKHGVGRRIIRQREEAKREKAEAETKEKGRRRRIGGSAEPLSPLSAFALLLPPLFSYY